MTYFVEFSDQWDLENLESIRFGVEISHIYHLHSKF